MNAKEFIKKFGWGEAKSFVNKTIELYGCITTLHYASNGYISTLVPHLVRDFDVSIADLRKYIDAYELVDNCGGLFGAKCDLDSIEYNLRCNVFHGYEKINMQSYVTNLKQAIALVEEAEA